MTVKKVMQALGWAFCGLPRAYALAMTVIKKGLAMTIFFLVTARNGMTKQSMDCHGADAPRNDCYKKKGSQ